MLRGVGLGKSFRGSGTRRVVLKDCTLSLPPGELTGIVGLNGVGKSTLLRILAGVLQPDAGSVSLADMDVTSRPLERRRQVVLIQSETRGFYWRLTCRDNLRFFAVLQQPAASKSAREAAVDAAMDELELTEYADQRFMTLSSGFMQRMALARGILQGGDYILMDEPARELDVPARERLLERMEYRVHRDGVGIAWVTHRPEELMGRARDFRVLLPGGEVRVVESAAEAEALLEREARP